MSSLPSGPWRVLVDGTHLGPEAKGVGLYTQNVLQRLLALDPRLHVDVVVLEGRDSVDLQAPNRVQWWPVPWKNHFWHGFRTLPQAVREQRPQAVWMPYETPMASLPVPFAVICHDIPSALRQAQVMGGSVVGSGGGWRHLLRRYGLHPLDDWLLGRTLRRAAWVFSNSQWVADGLADAYGLDRQRQRLAPCAPAVDFETLCQKVDRHAVRQRLGLPQGYVLTFDTGDPRENQRVVPPVFDRLMEGGADVGLVVAGVRPGQQTEVESLYDGVPWRSKVRFQPFLGAEQRLQLAELYAGASVYFDPSLQEGFGMQVVEAMACGTPVVCSHTSALPEVAGDAALLVDPQDPSAMVSALVRVLTDSELHRGLIVRGVQRSRRFRWSHTTDVVYRGLCEMTGIEAFTSQGASAA